MEPSSEAGRDANVERGGRPPDAAPAPFTIASAAGVACGVLAAALAVAWSFRPLAHDDLFWHLRTADWIWLRHSVPTSDPFTYTRFGAPWVSHEWGFSVVAWFWDRALGLRGLMVFTAVLTLGIGVLVARRAVRLGESIRWSLLGPLLALALLSCGRVIFLRPALLATLLLAAVLLAVERFKETGRRRYLLLVLGFTWLWANVHSNVVFGLALLGLQVTELWAVRRWPRLARDESVAPDAWMAKSLTWTLLGACGLCLLNPNGIRAPLFPLLLSRILFGSGLEWDLGQFTPESPLSNLPLLALGLLFLGAVALRRESGARLWELIAAALYFVGALRASRFDLEFAVVALPALYRGLDRRLPEREAAPSMRRIPALLGAGVALVLLVTLLRELPARPLRLLSRSLPEGAARFLRAHEIRGRLFHNSNQGGYLLWALDQPIFWDGRNDVFPSLVREVTTIDFPLLVERYRIDTLVLSEREMRDLRGEVEGGPWSLVYWDDAAAVYLRRDGPFAAAAQQLELHAFRSFSDGRELAALERDAPRREAARAELESLLATQPENHRALSFAAVLDLAAGDRDAARRHIESALRLADDPALRRTLDQLEQASPAGPR